MHLYVDKWADHGGMSGEQLWKLIHCIDALEKRAEGSTIYHCSAGIGRTGTTLLCQILSQLLRIERSNGTPDDQIYFNLPLHIRCLRQQRMGMIQSPEQVGAILDFFHLFPQYLEQREIGQHIIGEF